MRKKFELYSRSEGGVKELSSRVKPQGREEELVILAWSARSWGNVLLKSLLKCVLAFCFWFVWDASQSLAPATHPSSLQPSCGAMKILGLLLSSFLEKSEGGQGLGTHRAWFWKWNSPKEMALAFGCDMEAPSWLSLSPACSIQLTVGADCSACLVQLTVGADWGSKEPWPLGAKLREHMENQKTQKGPVTPMTGEVDLGWSPEILGCGLVEAWLGKGVDNSSLW